MTGKNDLLDLDKIVQELTELGLKHEVVASYDTYQLLDPESLPTNGSKPHQAKSRVQVRELTSYAPPEKVREFAAKMPYRKFPPIVVTQDNWLVDGNTRFAAYQLNKERYVPAVVIKEAYEENTEQRQHELRALAATYNCKAGKGLSAKEIRNVAEDFIALGWTTAEMAGRLGLKGATVGAIKREIDTEARFAKLGLVLLDRNSDPDDEGLKLSVSGLRALGAKDVLQLHDAQYQGLAELASDAGLNAHEIRDIAKQMSEKASDTEELEILAHQRVENESRIREHKLTNNGKPPKARQLRQALGNVTKYDGKVVEVVELAPRLMAEHLATIEKSITVLTLLRDLQRNKIAEAEAEGFM